MSRQQRLDDLRIGLYAAHELRRIAHIDPPRIAAILGKIVKVFRKKQYIVETFHETSSGIIVTDNPNAPNSHLFVVDTDTDPDPTVMCYHSVVEGTEISDESLNLDPDYYPQSLIQTALANGKGRSLSSLIQIAGFDVDTLAPKGIEEVYEDDGIVFRYTPQSIPFLPFRDTLLEDIRNMRTKA